MISLENTRELIANAFSPLEFLPETHQYFLTQSDGTRKELMCVSDFCHQFSNPTDFNIVAENYARKNGETAEYWLKQWDDNKNKATQMGTLVHEYAESLAWVRNGMPERICPSALAQYDPKRNDVLPLDDGSLMAVKQQAVYRFWNEMHPSLHFVTAENKICTGIGPQAENTPTNYAGTFDLLLYYHNEAQPEKSGFCIFDYKTNRELVDPNAARYHKFLKAPFGDLPDDSQSHYTIQQSCYQIPLENLGLNIIARRLVWLKADGTYQLVQLPSVTAKVRECLRK